MKNRTHKRYKAAMANPPREGYPQQISTQQTVLSLAAKQKYIEEFDFPFCAESSKYEKVAKIGQGTFG